MKIFTHSYRIVFYENGKFCWINKGWVKSDNPDAYSLLFMAIGVAHLIAFWPFN